MVSLKLSQEAAVYCSTTFAAAGKAVLSLLLQSPVAPIRGVPEKTFTTLFLWKVGINPAHFSFGGFFILAGGRVRGAGGP